MTRTKIVAKAVVVNDDNQILLLRRSQTDVRRPGEWDLPGGTVEAGEDMAAGAIREIQEEAGLTFTLSDLQLVYTHSHMWDADNVCRLFFVARSSETKITLSDEHDELMWVPLDDALETILYEIQKEVLTYIRDNDLLPRG